MRHPVERHKANGGPWWFIFIGEAEGLLWIYRNGGAYLAKTPEGSGESMRIPKAWIII